MSKTRDNHYVARWYQEGFFEPGRKNYRYLDLHPEVTVLPEGRSFTAKHRFTSAPAQCFYTTDLYTTFFGDEINDEIEKRLFGPIDEWGSRAVRAFMGTDGAERARHFQQFFSYLDAQKFRTPKGLDWLRRHYPALNQNELMREMQGIRMMNATIWTEGVREIVSAETAGIKFIVTDHPVTVYNYALPPEHDLCRYPNDPGIALNASQTIYPLSQNLCLILTNLEYAEDPDGVSPTDKRTFARNYRPSMVRTDAFIRSRQFNDVEVARVNFILKSRARRYIAAAREEWLYPETVARDIWADLRSTLLPPRGSRWLSGGEMYARLESGEVYYQDQFGRTERPRQFLLKNVNEAALGPNDACGCGSGKKYKKCCKNKPKHLRPSWSERSIRERNLMHCRAIIETLGLDKGKEWADVRRDLTDEQIAKIYSLHEALWPLETDILSLLPKPDGTARAVYTGLIDPRLIPEFAVGSCLYFEELIMENPFLHPGSVKPDFNPVKHPTQFHQEFLKATLLMLSVMPLIDQGILNVVPDLCTFNHHLRDQMVALAEDRLRLTSGEVEIDARTKWLLAEDFKRSILALPKEVMRRQIRQAMPELSETEADNVLNYQHRMRERDPLAAMSDEVVKPGMKGGLLQATKMAPNFEMSVYLARVTGAFILTDSPPRWRELLSAQHRHQGVVVSNAPDLCKRIEQADMRYVWDANLVAGMRREGILQGHRALMQDIYNYVLSVPARGRRQKTDSQLASRFTSINSISEKSLKRSTVLQSLGKMRCVIPYGGINHNNASRMLLTSGADHHMDSVPMAFFVETSNPDAYRQNLL
ncbi:DUF4238 domain-containing protein [Rhizobium ruizarguesonis]|nr:DUF4238 domain-containing protein [Rhizobium ruizarguesonis]TBD83253.1 hypothetical protein ELH11_14580 [Rhizobium ruizarguesonis]TBE12193.1 hypothetical protein ELH09_14660 [Rhizobium ruizarguesonis]